ncbi:unnamed protein product [Rotaria sordida]|uniref:Uncharacterized protein n=1 Tax=Rotaria sordida TaxID=392033 RepID=A0A819DYP5_9BILA|nr:unnamed protein product [Rotaria sordida]CAF3841373.1 unnamed protein product [Rotaria sordida]
MLKKKLIEIISIFQFKLIFFSNITIGVFGLDDAGKTSTVRAIEGDPTDNVSPTMGSNSTMVTHPLNGKNDRNNKNKNQQRIRMIDVSGERKFRQYSWSQYYDEIHGLIFVIDASERDRFHENQETLEDLLENDKLKDKPILILANKQDQRGAISNEYDLKRRLNIEKLKAKHKIELCTALPQDDKNKVDESIRKGFSWLIRTIDDNYTELNLRVTKAKNNRTNKKFNQFDNDENNNDNKYSKAKITSEKLPNIFTNKNKIKAANDDDDDDDDDDVKLSSTNDYNKKKKVLGGNQSNDTLIKRSTSNDPKAFRSTYESFPEETPWSTSSTLKITKSEDMLSRFSPKLSITNDTKRRNLSPLIHDTKSYTNGSLSKRDNVSDDEEDYYGQQKLKSTNRFDNSSLSTNKFSSNIKKPSSSIYDDDDNIYNKTNDRHTITTSKKSYSRYDDDDGDDDKYNYLKTSTTTKTNKSYDFNDNKNYQRSSDRLNLNNEYRGTLSKTTNRTKYDDDDDDNRPSSSLKKKPNSRFDDDDDDDDDYNSTSKPITRSTYNNNYSTSKPINRSKYNDNDNRWSSSKYDDDDYLSSSTKSTNLSKFEDNHYSSSKSMTHSKYDNEDRSYSTSKPISRSKYEDDDYPTTSKKSNYSSSYNNNNNNNNNYGTSTSRSRFEDDDDFFTSNGEPNNANRFRKRTDYDS